MNKYSEFLGEWAEVLDEKILDKTLRSIEREMQHFNVLPGRYDVFNAFIKCPYDKLSVIMLGQDPYPQKDIAIGIAFANRADTPKDKISPSLRVFLDSIDKNYNDLPCFQQSYDLEYLERQGVLLLNSALTVIENKPMSHAGLWWEFTKSFISNISNVKKDIIFVMMGRQAYSYSEYVNIKYNQNVVLEYGHPAYYARTGIEMPDFVNPINQRLISIGRPAIYWK